MLQSWCNKAISMQIQHVTSSRGLIIIFVMFTIVSCNFDAVSPLHPIQERIDSGEVKEGERPFLHGSASQVCVFQDGDVIDGFDTQYKNVPFNWIAIVEYRDNGSFIGYARNDDINHARILKYGNPTCFDRPEELYLTNINGIWTLEENK